MKIAIAKIHLLHLSPSVIETHIVVCGKADATEDLMTHHADPLAGIADPGLGCGYLGGTRKSLAQFPGCLISEIATGINIGNHIGTVALNLLIAADGATESYSFFSVGHNHI